MGRDCRSELRNEWRDGSGGGFGREYPVPAMPQAGATPLATVALKVGSRSAASSRRAGISAGTTAEERPHGRPTRSEGAARCDRAVPGRWLLPVIFGGAAIWAWIILLLI